MHSDYIPKINGQRYDSILLSGPSSGPLQRAMPYRTVRSNSLSVLPLDRYIDCVATQKYIMVSGEVEDRRKTYLGISSSPSYSFRQAI